MFLDVLYYFFVVLNISYENYPDGIYISVLIILLGFFFISLDEFYIGLD